jgi:hypothetical protein
MKWDCPGENQRQISVRQAVIESQDKNTGGCTSVFKIGAEIIAFGGE